MADTLMDKIERTQREHRDLVMTTLHITDAMRYAQQANDAAAKAGKPFSIPTTMKKDPMDKQKYWEYLAMRLRIAPGEKLPFDFMEFHMDKSTAFVFIVKHGKPVTIEDDINLFPSDSLITQLRLLIG